MTIDTPDDHDMHEVRLREARVRVRNFAASLRARGLRDADLVDLFKQYLAELEPHGIACAEPFAREDASALDRVAALKRRLAEAGHVVFDGDLIGAAAAAFLQQKRTVGALYVAVHRGRAPSPVKRGRPLRFSLADFVEPY